MSERAANGVADVVHNATEGLATERAARRLTDAGMDERAANGVADVVHNATDGLATEAGLHALEGSIATIEARMYRALWVQGMGMLTAIVAATGIILAAMRLWM